MKRTDLLHWLGIPLWVPVALIAIALILPAIKISTVQPAKIQIQLGGSK